MLFILNKIKLQSNFFSKTDIITKLPYFSSTTLCSRVFMFEFHLRDVFPTRSQPVSTPRLRNEIRIPSNGLSLWTIRKKILSSYNASVEKALDKKTWCLLLFQKCGFSGFANLESPTPTLNKVKMKKTYQSSFETPARNVLVRKIKHLFQITSFLKLFTYRCFLRITSYLSIFENQNIAVVI